MTTHKSERAAQKRAIKKAVFFKKRAAAYNKKASSLAATKSKLEAQLRNIESAYMVALDSNRMCHRKADEFESIARGYSFGG